MSHCGYPGHVGANACAPERYQVVMPSGRHYWVCESALTFVFFRGGRFFAESEAKIAKVVA